MSDLKNKHLFLLDMDGTIYLGSKLFEGTKPFLSYVKSIGGRYIFLTNNSSRGVDTYVKRMQKFGIDAKPSDFLTSTDATIDFLKTNYPNAVVYPCGTKSFKEQLVKEGINIREELCDEIDLLLLAYDTELTYKKIEDCCKLLNRGVTYIATHPDMVCPTQYGSAPDCGSFIVMFKEATGREPIVIGKPKPEMVKMAMKLTGYTPEETCVMGDRIYTDVACGVNASVDSIFVLSGEGVESDIEKYGIKPAYIFKDIASVLDELTNSK